MKNIIGKILNAVSIIIIIFSLFVLLTVVMSKGGAVPDVAGYSILRVLSGSMEPTYKTNSVILIHKAEPSEIKIGDVITFYSSDPALHGAVNTHRVTDIAYENGTYLFQTKGDANIMPDAYPVADINLIGVVVGSSVIIGTLVRLVSNPVIFIPLVLVPLAVIVIVNLRNTIVAAKELVRQEEEAEIKAAIEAAKKKRLEQENNE